MYTRELCKGSVSKTYDKAKKALKEDNKDLARDLCDLGILLVAQHRQSNQLSVDDTIDNVKIGLWLERFWYTLENNNLLLLD
jgi:hypothetical protein